MGECRYNLMLAFMRKSRKWQACNFDFREEVMEMLLRLRAAECCASYYLIRNCKHRFKQGKNSFCMQVHWHPEETKRQERSKILTSLRACLKCCRGWSFGVMSLQGNLPCKLPFLSRALGASLNRNNVIFKTGRRKTKLGSDFCALGIEPRKEEIKCQKNCSFDRRINFVKSNDETLGWGYGIRVWHLPSWRSLGRDVIVIRRQEKWRRQVHLGWFYGYFAHFHCLPNTTYHHELYWH